VLCCLLGGLKLLEQLQAFPVSCGDFRAVGQALGCVPCLDVKGRGLWAVEVSHLQASAAVAGSIGWGTLV
jgi:sulfite exporter TauE/SafE